MTKENILLSILAVAGLIILGVAMNAGLKKQELNECRQWHKDSRAYSNWTKAEWQTEQCRSYNIELN